LPIIQILIMWPDVYLLPWAWVGMISFDIIMITITLQIRFFIKEMDILGSLEEKVTFSKQLNIVMKHMNGAYANCIVTHSALSTAILLILLYGSIASSESLYLFAYFLANSFVLTARAIFLIMLLATLDGKSESFIRDIRVSSGSPGEIKLSRRQVRSLRSICMSSGGVYKIDYDCGYNYSEFLLSYIISVIKI